MTDTTRHRALLADQTCRQDRDGRPAGELCNGGDVAPRPAGDLPTAQFSWAFREAASGDPIWDAKLPASYRKLVEMAGERKDWSLGLSKKEVYAQLARPNPFDGGTKNEMNERELSALKAVIKCIEDRKLEVEYPVDTLQKRILQLEKAKADKWRAVEAGKPQSKRPRASGSTCAPRMTGCPDKSFYRAPEKYPYSYDRQYGYPAETRPLSVLGSVPYTLSPTHTTTYYGGGYQVQYAIPYLH